jgi:hypothetical protein
MADKEFKLSFDTRLKPGGDRALKDLGRVLRTLGADAEQKELRGA